MTDRRHITEEEAQLHLDGALPADATARVDAHVEGCAACQDLLASFVALSEAGVLCVEMECAALFCVAALRRVRAGAILAIDGDARVAAGGAYDPHREEVRRAIDAEIGVALRTALRLRSSSTA